MAVARYVVFGALALHAHPGAREQAEGDDEAVEALVRRCGASIPSSPPSTLIPQGGGDHAEGHRCPGEWATIEIAKVSLRALAALDYRLPPQDLSVRLARMPARPESGFVVEL